MSQPSQPRARGPAKRRRRDVQLDAIATLEERSLLTPIVTTGPLVATFTPLTGATNSALGTVTIAPPTTTTAFPTQAPTTTVTQLTPASSFGGDIVRIKAGPGGDFGKGVYAISRGGGANLSAANQPGKIFRVDPATGKSSVFFDLNTVVSQLPPPSPSAGTNAPPASGLLNWYDLAFDPEGYFDGKPSLFVSSVDQTNSNKNVIYRIAPDGSFMGAFVQFTSGPSGVNFLVKPSSILVPPVEDQKFLGGLIAGSGISSTGGTFAALFFDKNNYAPGQNINSTTLPQGVSQLFLDRGPQVGLTAANADYPSQVYSVFTDFGTPAAANVQAVPGLSGVQGNGSGELLIAPPATTTTTTNLTVDQLGVAPTPFRRFEDIAFDQYGYFSQGFPVTTTTTNTVVTSTLGVPVSAGSLFVTDLATGLQVTVNSIAVPASGTTPAIPATPVNIPIQGPGIVGVNPIGVGNVVPIVTNGNTTGGSNIGGRILRILPNGTVTTFAENFDTSGAQDFTSFQNSSLSITFSADGTTLYAADNDAIWQFKTSTDLANSTSGSLIGLNDLQTFGAPYEGQDTAVAVIDSGVDALSPPFRGRVAPGFNVVNKGLGSDDLAPGFSNQTTTTGTTTGTNNNILTGLDGHGTLIAGVVAQFVPQATINPVDVFNPFINANFATTGTGGGRGNVGTLTADSNAFTNSNNVYNGIKYVADHPFVNDPVRFNKADRVIAATFGFGSTTTFDSEGAAYRQFPQLIISFKNQLKRYRHLGIAPIAAAGQFGSPLGANLSGTGTGIGVGGTTTTGGTNNALNINVGDVNGMSLPAILNESISVTGVIPFPYGATPSSLPTDPPIGITPRPPAPILISGSTTTGATTTSQIATLLAGNTASGGTTTTAANATTTLQGLYSDRIIAAANRGVTTDFAAPAVDIPTFRRRFTGVTTTTGTTTTGTSLDPFEHLAFQDAGTSLSAGIVTGSFMTVSSALNYWSAMNQTGTIVDAYLTQPVGKNVLNFGAHPFKDLSAYNNPDGINAILAWTAVPVTDPNDALSQSQPPYLFNSTHFRQFARVDVGNAIAAIEGTEALQYLIDHNILPIIDANKNGIITAQELQTFVDNAGITGMPEAGAMARLLGGTLSTPAASPTPFGEQPDQAGALQRRFNFFDYAADGQLNGSVTIDQLKMLAHTLLPTPDAYVVNDRQRASANGFLLDPTAMRNFRDLQHLQPRYQFVPKGALRKYRNIAPDTFKVNRLVQNVDVAGNQFPVWTLFDGSNGNKQVVSASGTSTSTNPVQSASQKSTGNATPGTGSASANGPSTALSNTTASNGTTQGQTNTNAKTNANLSTGTTATQTSAASTSTTPTNGDGTNNGSAVSSSLAQQVAAIIANTKK